MTAARPAAGKDARITIELAAALLVVLAPLVPRLPLWALPTVCGLALWRFDLERRRRPPPGRLALVILTALAGAAVLWAARRPIDRDAFLTLLVLLSGLKFLETRTLRDRLLVVFLCLFLILAAFLYAQTIPMAFFMGWAVLFLTIAWVGVARQGRLLPVAIGVRLGSKLCFQAIPLAVLLFVLFPRVSGRLWGVPVDTQASRSGLSDRMSPGSVSQVALSDAVAFRVEFPEGLPAPAERYWRGLVLDSTDGIEWTGSDRWPGPKPPGASSGEAPVGGVEYAVALEPHGKHWLFALDVPVAAPELALLTPHATIWSRMPVDELLRYTARSRPRHDFHPLEEEPRARNLRVPKAGARVRALAERWKARAGSDREIVADALAHFRDEPFVYTLAPPPLGSDPLDEFLFETQKGFCEHFSGAFATLMRIAGIPARVVLGYQGGEYNPVGDYLMVRQAHAHAWAEVWLPDAGWERVDPTAAVAPDRVELPIDNTLLSLGAGIRFMVPGSGIWPKGIRGLSHVWDAASSSWNRWVLGYGPERQIELLSRVGFGRLPSKWLALLLAGASALVLSVLAAQVAWSQREPSDPVRRSYRGYCRKLGAKGLARLPYEGPLAYGDRVCAARGDLAPEVRAITDLYVRLRYAPRVTAGPDPGVRDLRSRVRRLRV